jgi:hypothetical protein
MSGHEIDDRPGERAELLCFLVATAAASRSLTHEWRVDHVVDSCRIWLLRHAVVMDWLERVKIGQLALQVAGRDLRDAGITVRQSDVQALFTGEMGLNHASTVVQKMMTLCSALTAAK